MRLAGLTVLLVEDDVDNLELIGSFIEAEGAQVLSAGSIMAALALSLGRFVDLVVSDMELADGDGCSLLSQLKKREGRADLPAVAVTGYSESRWRDKATACGFSRFLVKPFSLDVLVAEVAELSATNVRESSVRETSVDGRHAVEHPAERALPRR